MLHWRLILILQFVNEKKTLHSIPLHCRSRLAAANVSLPNLEGLDSEDQSDVISILCSIFLANQGSSEAAGEEKCLSWVRNLVCYCISTIFCGSPNLLFESSCYGCGLIGTGGSWIHCIR